MTAKRYAAVDLGAESGRVMVGSLDGERIELREVYRFANAPVRTPDGAHWDALRIYSESLNGLRAAVSGGRAGSLDGIGVDSWGVDYGLLDEGGRLLGNPYTYRDARTDGMPERAASRVPADEQYARTGIAQLQINSLYQLMASVQSGDRSLELARFLLMMPDLMHYWLSGERAVERTNASTTGMLDVEGAWATDILRRLDVPTHMLLPPVPAGTVLGALRRGVGEECGLGPVPVILPPTHDTAGAVLAVPFRRSAARGGVEASHAYISSGTWSLLGLELDRPVLGEEARLAGFTNEHGFGGTYRFLTNIMGLWLVQECRRSWEREGQRWSYDDLTAAAAGIPSPHVVLDVDDPAFLHPADMPTAIVRQLSSAGRGTEYDRGALVRIILEGLALKYRIALARAERLAGARVETVHIVGGGARNSLLCRLTADACERQVVAGPIEATAMGNILVQAIGAGEVRSVAEARALILASTKTRVYEPGGDTDWAERQEELLLMRAR